jgi:alpha-acetolactate decarboxylase
MLQLQRVEAMVIIIGAEEEVQANRRKTLLKWLLTFTITDSRLDNNSKLDNNSNQDNSSKPKHREAEVEDVVEEMEVPIINSRTRQYRPVAMLVERQTTFTKTAMCSNAGSSVTTATNRGI